MANLSITRRCRRGCSYCFAKHELGRGGVVDMPLDVFDSALSFLKRAGIPEARLLGGEPTEHPEFCDYVSRARRAGFSIIVFSGGLVSDEVLEYIDSLPADGFQIILNAADPACDPPELVRRQERLCELLGEKVMLGINIRSVGQRPVHLIEWIGRYGLRRKLRVGLTHPTLGGSNSWLRIARRREIGLLEGLCGAADRAGIGVGFDCGFTPCMFSESFVRENEHHFNDGHARVPGHRSTAVGDAGPEARAKEASIGRCSSVIDILPDGTCIACYALSRVIRRPLTDTADRGELLETFEAELSSLMPPGVFRECDRCRYLAEGLCDGGCRARRALRLRPDATHLLLRDEHGAGKAGSE